MPIYDTDIPAGLCQCGCGSRTKTVRWGGEFPGAVYGQPRRFLRGHSTSAIPRHGEYTIDAASGCWIWNGQLNERGYGRLVIDGKRLRAHRYIYERECGPIPDGTELDHTCRNHACVNPSHLESVPHNTNVQRGDLTKLTPAQVSEIRALSRSLSNEVIAGRFGITRQNVRRIVTDQTWKNVP